jgi:hypothetical protein
LTDQPVQRQVSDANAVALATDYVNGTITVNPLPTLRIALAEENISLSWPQWASNFVLQQASEPLGQGGWTNLEVNVVTSDGGYVATLPLEAGARFYRLHQQ